MDSWGLWTSAKLYYNPGGEPGSVNGTFHKPSPPATYPYAPTHGIKYEFEDNSGRQQMIDDFNRSMEGKVQQMGDWLYLLTRIPTTGELVFWGLGPIPGIYDFLPEEDKYCP